MSTSFVQIPTTKYAPGYNTIKYLADSTNKNLNGFRYVYDIYPAGTVLLSSSTIIAEFIIAPRIGDGFGVLYAEEIFQNYLTYDFDKTGSNYLNPTNSWESFDVYVGEAYSEGWLYNDYEFNSATGSTNGLVKLRQFASATTHSFIVGDQVNIVQNDAGATKPQLSGLHVVTAINSPYEIVIELPFSQIGSGPTIGGNVEYADGRRTVSRHQIMTAITAFNGVFPLAEPYVESTYRLSTAPFSGKSFLTTCPREFRNTPDQKMWFNLLNDRSSNITSVYFNNSNGDIMYKDISSTNQPLRQVGVGAGNVNNVIVLSGTLPLVKDSTEWYEINIVTSGGTELTTTPYRINIDRRCAIDYGFETYQIAFLDRLGSFGSFAFPLKFKDTTKLEKNEYNKDNEFDIASPDLTEGGMTNYQVDLEREFELNTNYMTEAESKYFDEMFASPCVLLYYKQKWIRVTVSDENYETMYQRNKNLIKRTIKVKPALQDSTNI